MIRFAHRAIIAAAGAALAGCGSGLSASSPPSASSPSNASSPLSGSPPSAGAASQAAAHRAYPAAFVAAVSGQEGQSAGGLAVFSSSDGRLLRWLVRGAAEVTPVAVSPAGQWVYYYFPATPPSRCPYSGFAEPALWRVHVNGGRAQRTGLRTTGLAFSPDGKMVAYTSSRRCGRILHIVVRDQRTRATRSILVARNVLTGTGPIFTAQLSWSPDDTHLAVAVEPDAAIDVLYVINAQRATDITRAKPIPPCTGGQVGCLDPAFDTHSRLTFLKWREGRSSFAEGVMRWQNGQVTRLFQLSRNLFFPGSIAVDRTGNAILVDGGRHYPQIWRWSGGQLELVLRPTAQAQVTSPIWLTQPAAAPRR